MCFTSSKVSGNVQSAVHRDKSLRFLFLVKREPLTGNFHVFHF